MNRNAKGAIAVGAATLLLLGGGGTFALWNTSGVLTPGTVTSGQLSLTGGTTGTWYDFDDYDTNGTGATPIDTLTYRVVPEDHLIFVSSDATLTAVGGDLYYTFKTTLPTPTANGFTATFDVIGTPPGTSYTTLASGEFSDGSALPAGTTVYHVTSATPTTTGTFNVTIEVEFDADDQDDFNTPLNLNSVQYSLQQVVES